MVDALEKIYAAKAAVLKEEQAWESYDDLRVRGLTRKGQRRGFLRALRRARGAAIIAEIKRASPSAGLIARNFDPPAIARLYDSAGVDAISVLTERDHFLGELAHLDEVRAMTKAPILRKDFLWTRYQIAQTAAYGADCALLIVAGMDDTALRDCMQEAAEYALDVLVEAHDETELRRAIELGAQLIGINNRSLRTMTTDLAVSEHLLPKVPSGAFALSESGVRTASDIARLRAAGAQGFLVGEALMRSPDPLAVIESLRASTVPDALTLS